MGGNSTTKSNSNTLSTQTTTPDQAYINQGQNILNVATPEAANYHTYTDPRVAQFNDLFNQATGLVENQTAGPSQDLTNARTAVNGVANSINPNASINDLMNPYVQGVLDPTIRNLNDQGAIARNTIGAQAAGAGAFGDSGYGLATAQQLKNQGQAVTDATNQAYSQAFNAATAQKNTNNSTLLAAGSQDQALENADLTRTTTLSGLLDNYSNQQRALDQAGLDANYQQYQSDMTEPLQMWQSLMGMVNAAPKSTTTTGNSATQGTSQQPDTGLTSLLGAGVGALGSWAGSAAGSAALAALI